MIPEIRAEGELPRAGKRQLPSSERLQPEPVSGRGVAGGRRAAAERMPAQRRA